ncbi:MAG: MgtC/SapB family protein [Clostridia bacterium]
MDKFLSLLSIEYVYLVRVIIAGICGFFVGIERMKRQKEAGLTTHFIVAAASCLMMCVSVSFGDDPARIAAQIIPGIGFLGAGLIFFRRETLHGLTTAAGIWATAGIGMSIGAGLYLLGLSATVVIVVAQWLFHAHFIRYKTTFHLLLVRFDYTQETVSLLKQYFGVREFERFKAFEENDGITAECVIRTQNDCGSESITHVLTHNNDIHSIERLED